MTRRRRVRRSGPPPSQVEAMRRLLEAEAARHEPDRAAIYRRVLDTTSEDRALPAGRALSRRRGPGPGRAASTPTTNQRRARRAGLARPKVVAGATAAVVMGVAVATGAVTFDEPPATPSATALPTSVPDDAGPATPSATATTAAPSPSSATAGPRPEDNPPVHPPAQSPTAVAGPTATVPATQPGLAQPGTSDGNEPAPAVGPDTWFQVSPATKWSTQARIELPGRDTIDWALFGDGNEGVYTRAATRERAIDVDGPRGADAESGFSNRFGWSSGTPLPRGSDYIDRLSLGEGESVVLTVEGDPSQERHLDLYLGSYSGSVKLAVSLGDQHDDRRVELPAGDVSRPADGVVTVSFRTTDPGTELRVEIRGEDGRWRSQLTVAAVVLR